MASSNTRRHLVILGCGFMGTAILQGLLNKSDQQQQWHYTAIVRSESSLERLRRQFNDHDNVTVGKAGDSNVKETAETDVVMIGCAPGDLDALLSSTGLIEALKKRGAGKTDTEGRAETRLRIVSLLAGVSTTQLTKALESQGVSTSDTGMDIARVIPSIGAKIGDSVTLLARSASLSDAGQQDIHNLFSRVGAVLPIDEKLMDDATAIGAACHALNILALDAITDASVAEGVDRPTAVALAAETLRGSANLFCTGGMTSEELKQAMSTPRGITINSLLHLRSSGVPGGIGDAVRAAIQYARSM